MFEQGKKNAPCIIFIDEIDAVGRHRGAGLGGGNDEREQTLNQLLVEMDGFEANEGVILIAATNRPDVLDPALLRPAASTARSWCPIPTSSAARRSSKCICARCRWPPMSIRAIIARGTPGFSGADLANLVNEAALMAARKGKRSVTHGRVRAGQGQGHDGRRAPLHGHDRGGEEADRLSRGAATRSGHALCRGHEPLHKVTIIPRGRALGVTMFLPERDKYGQSKMELEAMIAIAVRRPRRRRADLRRGQGHHRRRRRHPASATNLARRMVTECGFSEKLGPLRYSENEEEVFLGHSVTQRKNVSDATAKVIDEEIRRIVEEGEETARDLLTGKLEELHDLAKGLLEYETLSGEECRKIVKGEPITRDSSTTDDVVRPTPRRSSIPPTGGLRARTSPAAASNRNRNPTRDMLDGLLRCGAPRNDGTLSLRA